MKRTHDDAMQPEFPDPVSLEPVTEPYVLAACGHTIDGSTASDLFKNDQYICPECRTVSRNVVPNYALETVLGLEVQRKSKPVVPVDVLHAAIQEDAAAADSVALECDATFHKLLAAHILQYKGLPWAKTMHETEVRPRFTIKVQDYPCFDCPQKVLHWTTHRIAGKTNVERMQTSYGIRISLQVRCQNTDITSNMLAWSREWEDAMMYVHYFRPGS